MPDPLTEIKKSLKREEIVELLPYGENFMFIDTAYHLFDRQILTFFDWGERHPLVFDHFRAGPKIVPGVLLIEHAAQSALLLAVLEGEQLAGNPLMLCQVRCDMVSSAIFPCRVEVRASVSAIVTANVGFNAVCSVEGRVVAKIRGIAAPMPGVLQ